MEAQWLTSVFKYERIGWLQIPTKKRGAEKTSGRKTNSCKGKQVEAEFLELEVVEKSRWQRQPKKQEEEPGAWRRVPADSVGSHLIGDNRPWETDPKEEHRVGVGQGTGELMSGQPGDHGRLNQGQESGTAMKGDQYHQTTDVVGNDISEWVLRLRIIDHHVIN